MGNKIFCKYCGKPISEENSAYVKDKFCSWKCRHWYYERKKIYKDVHYHDNMKELTRMAVEAKQHGMSYGQWASPVRGERWEKHELRDTCRKTDKGCGTEIFSGSKGYMPIYYGGDEKI